MRFDQWWCDSHKDSNVLQLATSTNQLPPCWDKPCRLWQARISLTAQLAEAQQQGQDQTQLIKQLRACTPHGSMGRYLSSNKQAWRGLPETQWPQPAACTVGDVAARLRATLRQAWWPGIPEEMQQPMQLGGAIDYLHEACERPALTLAQQQRVLQAAGGAAGQAGQMAALHTELINTALGTQCMRVNTTCSQGALPPGCTVHHRSGAGAPLSQRPQPSDAVYLRVQVSSNVRDNAHRWLAWLRLGPPPQADWSHDATHLCNNKNCLNPYHIVWVSTSPAQRSSETVGAGRRGGAPGSGHVSCWVHMGSMGVTWL
jgi:hypothetical protein